MSQSAVETPIRATPWSSARTFMARASSKASLRLHCGEACKPRRDQPALPHSTGPGLPSTYPDGGADQRSGNQERDADRDPGEPARC